jgi:transcriptional regulator with XRE-family HTH domain
MTLGEKLARLRKEYNYTQEQLAQLLGVSRQAVSRWESNLAYPETEKLLRLGDLYQCSMDYLLKDEPNIDQSATKKRSIYDLHFEKKSRRMIGNLPLWHINIGLGRMAKGVFAVGLTAKGVVSVGVFALGAVSLGTLSVGFLSLGALALGILAAGAISVGIVSVGAISVGIFALGALAMGQFAIGALAIGNYAAWGDVAHGSVAIGMSEAVGDVYQSLTADKDSIATLLEQTVPGWLKWAAKLFMLLIK